MARCLKKQVWKPGDMLVKQGAQGHAFFLIQEGEASVVFVDGDGKEHECAKLTAGDYFGGHTLTTNRPHVASTFARGPGNLVTLSMSRMVFEQTGLKSNLRFPKRPAIYTEAQPQSFKLIVSASDLQQVNNAGVYDFEELKDEEQAF